MSPRTHIIDLHQHVIKYQVEGPERTPTPNHRRASRINSREIRRGDESTVTVTPPSTTRRRHAIIVDNSRRRVPPASPVSPNYMSPVLPARRTRTFRIHTRPYTLHVCMCNRAPGSTFPAIETALVVGTYKPLGTNGRVNKGGTGCRMSLSTRATNIIIRIPYRMYVHVMYNACDFEYQSDT